MATMFLQVPGVQGDVTAGSFKKQITLHDTGHGSSRSIRSAVNSSKNRESSTISVSELSFVKKIDPASNELWLKSFKDGMLGNCIVSYVRTADGQEAYRTVELQKCIISGFSCECPAGSDRAMERITLNFTEIQQTFKTTDAKNNDTSSSTSGYDLAGGKPI